VAPISRLLKITGLFCRIKSLLQGSFAKETYHFKELTSRSHPKRLERLLQSTYDVSVLQYVAVRCSMLHCVAVCELQTPVLQSTYEVFRF